VLALLFAFCALNMSPASTRRTPRLRGDAFLLHFYL